MIWQLAEVAPAAPLIIDALPPLIILAGLFVALGLVMLIDAFVRALFGALSSVVSVIPGLGGLTSAAIHRAEQAISNALGNGISGIETRIAHQFHNLAGVLFHFWHTLERSAVNVFDLAKLVAGAATFPDIHALQRKLTALIHSAEHSAEVAILHALHAAKVFTHSVAQGVYPRLRALEHDVTKTIPKEIKATRTLAKEAEAEATRAWNLVRTRPWEVTTAVFAGAVAIALTTLGIGHLTCNNFKNLLGKWKCGLGTLLDDLLGLAIAAIALESVCEFLPLIEAAFGAIVGPMVHLLNEVPLGACETPPDSWAKLNVDAGPRPPAQTLGTFPG
jgi:hypothetical protein